MDIACSGINSGVDFYPVISLVEIFGIVACILPHIVVLKYLFIENIIKSFTLTPAAPDSVFTDWAVTVTIRQNHLAW